MENINVDFTAEAIAALGGFILMLAFAYLPTLRVAYGGLESNVKSFIMLGLLVVVEVAVGAAAYYGIIPVEGPVTWEKFVSIAIALLVSNQPTYSLLPEMADVAEAKALR